MTASLPIVSDFKIQGKKVLLRANYDVPLTSDSRVADGTRIYESFPTIDLLVKSRARVIAISHLDRPGGKTVPGLSLLPVVERIKMKRPDLAISFSGEILGEKTKRMVSELDAGQVLVLENLRFDTGEIKNDEYFARSLADLADFFVNDAFAASHRRHASIVGIPQFLPAAFGSDFLGEVEVFSKIIKQPLRPVVLVLGGRKKSKLADIKRLSRWADYVLIGGLLVEYPETKRLVGHPKINFSLNRAGEDISQETVVSFQKVIARAKTVVWSGPMGAFEDEKYQNGTKKIAEAVAGSDAYKIVGGGDTEAALTRFGLKDKIDYISCSGSAMLVYLAQGTLAGIEAIVNKS